MTNMLIEEATVKLALDALEETVYWRTTGIGRPPEQTAMDAIIALREALAEQPAQSEPVALFKWLPKGATHIGSISVSTAAGGLLEMTAYAFRYDSAVLKVYVTDNDNQYPGWRDAKNCFFHLNFPVLPLYNTPQPAQRKPLTDEEISNAWCATDSIKDFVKYIEATHNIKENT